MMFIGADPGRGGGGGLAAIYDSGTVVSAISMPPDDSGIWRWLCNIAAEAGNVDQCYAVIEQLHTGFKGSNKHSIALAYGSYRALQMAMTAAGIQSQSVPSSTWHLLLGIPSVGGDGSRDAKYKQRKRQLLNQAILLFPDARITKANCDALLLAEFGKRWYNSRYGNPTTRQQG